MSGPGEHTLFCCCIIDTPCSSIFSGSDTCSDFWVTWSVLFINVPNCVQHIILLEGQFGPWPLERSSESTFWLIPSYTDGWKVLQVPEKGPWQLTGASEGSWSLGIICFISMCLWSSFTSLFWYSEIAGALLPEGCPFPRKKLQGGLWELKFRPRD